MTGLPTGTVTFLFTDLEGSTRRWEFDPSSMGPAVAEHDEILRTAIEDSHGRVFKHMGDGVCAVFGSAGDAVSAALSLQRAFLSEEQRLGLRVRAAVHTGTADLRGDDYFGSDLNRVARLLETAHGTQSLLSGAAVDASDGGLPANASARELGTFRLRDLSSPIRVYQLDHPDLPAEFPPLRSLETFEHNLPIESDAFIGRLDEMATIRTLLEDHRIVTLTGAGGSGKTRLAIQAAADSLELFPNGVWLVELGRVDDAELLADSIASSLHVADRPGSSVLDALTAHLGDKRLLLVLDNCEHMVEPAAALVERLVTRCPDIKILTTSREGLRVPGETVLHLAPLAAPSGNAEVEAASIADFESVQLFVDRARHHKPGFTLDAANASAVASVCHRLDGLPLALELAAARLRMFSPQQISERLDDRFKLLTGGRRTSMPRHQTLEAAVAWSYGLLGPAEQLLLARLSVFRGGFDLDAAEEICSDYQVPKGDVIGHLSHLIDSSLIEPQELEAGGVRYRLLETIRQYAAARLLDGEGAAAVRVRHARYYEDIASGVEEALRGPDSKQWMALLDLDRDNFRAALNWALEIRDIQLAVTIQERLSRYWYYAEAIQEGLRWIDRAMEFPLPESPETIKMLAYASFLAFHRGDMDASERYAAETEPLAARLGDPDLNARAHGGAGATTMRDARAGVKLYQQTVDRARATGNTWELAAALFNTAFVHAQLGDFKAAREMEAEHRTILESAEGATFAAQAPMHAFMSGFIDLWTGDLESGSNLLAQAHAGLAGVNLLFTDYSLTQWARALNALDRRDEAHQRATEAYVSTAKSGAGVAQAWALQELARADLGLGRLGEAREHVDEGLRLTTGGGIDLITVELLEILGAIEAAEANDEQAVRRLSTGATLRERVGIVRPAAEEQPFHELVQTLRDRLGSDRFDTIWARGSTEAAEG